MTSAKHLQVLALIPARGRSKKVPRKNLRPLAGKPLIVYTFEQTAASRYLTRVILSTDDPEIAELGRKHGVEVPFLRPPELAEDLTPDLPVFQHALAWLRDKEDYAPDIVVHLRPTAPLRRPYQIEEGIELLLESPDADSVRSVTVCEKHPYKMWREIGGYLEPFLPESVTHTREPYNLPRQMLPIPYVQNGSVDVIWTRTIVKLGSMTGKRIRAYIMEEEDSVNINTEGDFLLAEIFLSQRRQ